MKNDYYFDGDTIIICLQAPFTTRVSIMHLAKLQFFPGRWTADKDRTTGKYYVKNQTMRKGVNTTTVLPRFLLGAPPGTKVDHANGDTLNNLDDNIRAVSSAFNSQNRTLRNTRSKTGYRAIREAKGRYRPIPMVNGKRRYLSTYGSLEEAVAVLKAFYDLNGIPYIEDKEGAK